MTHYAHIENEVAYERAKEARIKANRRKGARARWLSQHDDGQFLVDWLENAGEFAPQWQIDDRCSFDEDGYPDHCFENHNGSDYRCKCKMVHHPLTKFNSSPFLTSMRDRLQEWGDLSEKQTAAVRDSLARAEGIITKRAIEREQRLLQDQATSNWVGDVGERRNFVLTVERSMAFDSQYGWTFINICRDADQNVIVYKGSKEWKRGETVTCKATVKAHDTRDGVRQTAIARPKEA